MPAPVDATVLRRKIAAHTRPAAPRPDPSAAAGRGLGRALRHAAMPFEGLGLSLGEVTVTAEQTLEAAVDALPDQGLVAVLEGEGEGGQRGLVALSCGLVDALVEVQTTGRVEAGQLAARPVTRIDEALARDFMDFALSAFAQETAGAEGRTWPARLRYGSRVGDRGQITLLLPEGCYTLMSADLGFDGVARRAEFVMAVPTDPAHVQPAAGAAPGAGPGARAPDADWLAARRRVLDALRLPLEVVLLRVTRPLAQVQALAVGDLLAFSPADLQEVALEDAQGHALAHGRLGQIGGRRAVRLPASEAKRPSDSPAADPPPPAAEPDAPPPALRSATA